MVGRREITPVIPIVVDLDGTLIRGNSLHIYIRCGMRNLLSRGRLCRASRLACTLLRRKLHRIDHREMKWRAAEIIGTSPALMHRVTEQLTRRIRPEVLQIIRETAAIDSQMPMRVLLATASFSFLANSLADSIPEIDMTIATPFGNNTQCIEMRGAVKAEAVTSMFGRGVPFTLLTDHYDDLPLMRIASQIILVAPSEATLEAVTSAGISFSQLPCSN